MHLLSPFRMCARYAVFHPWGWRIGGRKFTTVNVRARPLDARRLSPAATGSPSCLVSMPVSSSPLTDHPYCRHLTWSPCCRCYSTGSPSSADKKSDKSQELSGSSSDEGSPTSPPEKLTYWQRFKQMYKEYWYVLIPVHCVTSVFWYGSFYYAAKSGVDIVPLLQQLGCGETILKPLRDTGAGYFAVAYAIYKIATPARYTVTLGGTTVAINYLRRWGVIRPVPSAERMRAMIQEKGRELRSRRAKVLAKMNLRRQGGGKSKDSE